MPLGPFDLHREPWVDPVPMYRVLRTFTLEPVHALITEGSIIYQYGTNFFFSDPKTNHQTAIDLTRVKMVLRTGWLEAIPAVRAEPKEKPLTRTRFQRILADVDDLP
jgi:hypothetical protein